MSCPDHSISRLARGKSLTEEGREGSATWLLGKRGKESPRTGPAVGTCVMSRALYAHCIYMTEVETCGHESKSGAIALLCGFQERLPKRCKSPLIRLWRSASTKGACRDPDQRAALFTRCIIGRNYRGKSARVSRLGRVDWQRGLVTIAYIPDRGDAIWLDFTPQLGHEQAGRHPALVLSPTAYNSRVSLAPVCPITRLC